MSGAAKYDAGKVRMELFPSEAIFAISTILTFGSRKYSLEIQNEWHALLHVPNVLEILVTTPKGSVVRVTKNTSDRPIPNTQSANVRIVEIGKPATQIASASWQSVERLIRHVVSGTPVQDGSFGLESAASPKSSTTSYAPKDVQSAGPKNTCTLTIVTAQGSSEASFAPDATTDSAFWTTVWKELSEHCGISKPQSKTGDRNWELGMDWSRVFGAMMRHMWCWWAGKGPTNKNFAFGSADEETSYSHLWHAGACVCFLITYEMRGAGLDDRPVAPDLVPSQGAGE